MIPEVVAAEIARIAGVALVGVSGVAALTLIICARWFRKSYKEKKS